MNDGVRPRLLDLFCGAGGAAMGYYRAGFEIVGVDNRPQRHYPFEFHQDDAIGFLRRRGHEFDAAGGGGARVIRMADTPHCHNAPSWRQAARRRVPRHYTSKYRNGPKTTHTSRPTGSTAEG